MTINDNHAVTTSSNNHGDTDDNHNTTTSMMIVTILVVITITLMRMMMTNLVIGIIIITTIMASQQEWRHPVGRLGACGGRAGGAPPFGHGHRRGQGGLLGVRQPQSLRGRPRQAPAAGLAAATPCGPAGVAPWLAWPRPGAEHTTYLQRARLHLCKEITATSATATSVAYMLCCMV